MTLVVVVAGEALWRTVRAMRATPAGAPLAPTIQIVKSTRNDPNFVLKQTYLAGDIFLLHPRASPLQRRLLCCRHHRTIDELVKDALDLSDPIALDSSNYLRAVLVSCINCHLFICTTWHWCHEYQANHEIRVSDRCDAFY